MNLLRTELIACQNCRCLALANRRPGFCEGAGLLASGAKFWFLVLCEMKMKFSLVWTIRPDDRCIAVEPFPVPM